MHVLPIHLSGTDGRLLRTAAAALGASVVLTAIGTYANDGESSDTSIASYVVFVAVLAVVTAAVYALAVRRAEAHEAPARTRTALSMGVLSVLSVAVFWTGLPTVLAAAAILLAYDARTAGNKDLLPVLAAGLGGLAIAAAIVLAWTG